MSSRDLTRRQASDILLCDQRHKIAKISEVFATSVAARHAETQLNEDQEENYMPMILTQGGPIPNYANPTGAQRRASPDAIGDIDYADIFGGAGTIGQDGQRVMRVDMQGDIAGPPIVKNLQVQINGVGGHTTVAHALVSTTLLTTDPANRRGVTNKVMAALNRSLDSGCTYTVSGTAP